MMARNAFVASQRQIMVVSQRGFVKSMEERKEAQEKKAFQDDIAFFISKEVFTLHDFHERVLVSISNSQNSLPT